MISDLFTAFSLGLLGSMHCVGMCGPIAVALPLGKKSLIGRVAGGLAYNVGRSLTYGIMGALFGLLGKGISMAGFQQWASVIMGIAMILSVLFPALFRGKWDFNRIASRYTGKLIMRFRKLFGKPTKINLLMIGLLNGLLPCGLVYIAIAGAINTNDALLGVLYMLLFGLGTIPLMLGVSLAGNLISQPLRAKFVRIVPVVIVILGILFILRGLSLGIPFISPKSQMLAPRAGMMHHH